jgi:hypothetical protein
MHLGYLLISFNIVDYDINLINSESLVHTIILLYIGEYFAWDYTANMWAKSDLI